MATKFGWLVCIALCWLIHENHAVVRQVTYNEDELIGSCTKTCSTLPDRTNKFGCDRISHCRTSRTGWTRGFVRCDWCRCLCTVTHTMTPPTIHKTVSVSAEVPPHEDLNVRVTGWRFRGRVPYTADHVIVYKDGQERRQRVSGYLNEVSVFGFESSTGTMVVE